MYTVANKQNSCRTTRRRRTDLTNSAQHKAEVTGQTYQHQYQYPPWLGAGPRPVQQIATLWLSPIPSESWALF